MIYKFSFNNQSTEEEKTEEMNSIYANLFLIRILQAKQRDQT